MKLQFTLYDQYNAAYLRHNVIESVKRIVSFFVYDFYGNASFLFPFHYFHCLLAAFASINPLHDLSTVGDDKN